MNLREFCSWAIDEGVVANPEPNNKYPGQCVSLIQQYLYKVFGIPFKAHGNAKDWANNIPAGFDKLSSNTPLQKGDILVYGANYGGGYGHIGLINDTTTWLDQNGVISLRIGTKPTPFTGYICILRKQGGVDIGDIQPSYKYKIGDTVKVSSYYVSSTTPSNEAVIKNATGTITRINEGTKNPYLLNDGAIGWCNDGDIRELVNTQPIGYKYSVGQLVTYSTAYKAANDSNNLAYPINPHQRHYITEIINGAKNPYKLGNNWYINDGDIRKLN